MSESGQKEKTDGKTAARTDIRVKLVSESMPMKPSKHLKCSSPGVVLSNIFAHSHSVFWSISPLCMCHHAKAPHSQGPKPPPNPRHTDHPTHSLTGLVQSLSQG